MTLSGKRGSRAMAGAGATSLPGPAACPPLPCHALPHPGPPHPRPGGVTCPSCLSPCTPASST